MYKTANDYYKEKFGDKVYKLSIDAGFTCPNRDGTLGKEGCIFSEDPEQTRLRRELPHTSASGIHRHYDRVDSMQFSRESDLR